MLSAEIWSLTGIALRSAALEL